MPNIVDDWSLRAVPLKLMCNTHQIAVATGFFWKYGLEVFLVTNWHVLSGRDPQTMVAKHSSSAVPDSIIYPRFVDRNSLFEIIEVEVKLIDGEGKNVWLENPVHGSDVDVAVIKVPWVQEGVNSDGLHVGHIYPVMDAGARPDPEIDNMFPSWSVPRYEMGDDLFVIGFPLNLKPTGHVPLWKRASVASEMDILLEGKRAFLIDTATREGMSGSPVVHIDRSGPVDLSGTFKPGRNITFVGVYSGRHIGTTTIEAQLGIVWRAEVIRETVLCGRAGTPDLTRLPG